MSSKLSGFFLLAVLVVGTLTTHVDGPCQKCHYTSDCPVNKVCNLDFHPTILHIIPCCQPKDHHISDESEEAAGNAGKGDGNKKDDGDAKDDDNNDDNDDAGGDNNDDDNDDDDDD